MVAGTNQKGRIMETSGAGIGIAYPGIVYLPQQAFKVSSKQ